MTNVPDEIESDYYAAQGFDPEHSRLVRSHYLPFVAGRSLLVELGCGRGEFMSLVAEQQVVDRVVGVDIDPAMVAAVRAAGHDAVEDDLLHYLDVTDDRPDAVFLAHVIEHLTVGESFAMLKRLAELIPVGGRLIVVTPNPACLANLTNDFWSDPTHVRLYTLDLMSFLFNETGFEVVDQGGNPLDIPGPPPTLLAPVKDLPPWGSATVELPEQTPLTYEPGELPLLALEELTRFRITMQSMLFWLDIYNERMSDLRHIVEGLSKVHDETLRWHYGANEIYVVGERRA